MQGLVLKGANDGTDAYGAFDGAAHKIEKQLRRYMRRLKDRNQSEALATADSFSYDNAGYTIFSEAAGEEEIAIDHPLIVAETRANIPETSVRSEEHTSELQSLMRNSYAVFCLQKQ